jgi:hypothetical protein
MNTFNAEELVFYKDLSCKQFIELIDSRLLIYGRYLADIDI